jgi:hypothetical protein
LGVFRFWRDAGAIGGALLGGTLADALGFSPAIAVVAAMTLTSGLVASVALSDKVMAGQTKVEVTP